MENQKIDLYGYFKLNRNGAAGGYLTVCARTESKEMTKRIRPAVLVIAGGGYAYVSDRESEPVAIKYMNAGYIAFTLDYSIETAYPAPLIEAVAAIAYIRENADKYGIEKNRVAALGFSAGGHLTGLLATVKEGETPFDKPVKELRPDAAILCYPVITLGEFTHEYTRNVISGRNEKMYEKLSVEKRVDADCPPAFIWHTYEDTAVPVENSFLFAGVYRKNNVPFAMHIFEKGGHGLSTSDIETVDFTQEQMFLQDNAKWFDLTLDWLKARDFKVKRLLYDF